jgi:hypothetical protein
MDMAVTRPVFTLIGDVIASRQTGDRRLLQQRLDTVLREVNDRLMPLSCAHISVLMRVDGLERQRR